MSIVIFIHLAKVCYVTGPCGFLNETNNALAADLDPSVLRIYPNKQVKTHKALSFGYADKTTAGLVYPGRVSFKSLGIWKIALLSFKVKLFRSKRETVWILCPITNNTKASNL